MTERIRGLDGKTYLARRLGDAERQALVDHVHQLRHEQGLSLRGIRASLQLDHGITRSLGWLCDALRNWQCAGCARTSEQPAEAEPQPTSSW